MTRDDEDTTLFVYGSLLESSRRIAIIGHDVATALAVLHDYVVERARNFYIRSAPGRQTQGLLLLGLETPDFARLDEYEEVPVLYTREKVAVVDGIGITRRCWIYIPTPLMFEREKL
jgi:gamma-glutamylcyclotransferase (GGCT)/AIG2-like uncharacterized protein YtfP